ncbi:Ig-like domain-containing protein [Parapedobacter sp. DT-150]|uniref:Ig-like domain-containing protein n=1 Tax=Parapedobacter sp. DT-150 TaxID=3396162 RepID=UPI003F1B2858
METSSTYPKSSFLRFFLSLLVMCGMVSTGWGQTKQYADVTPNSGRNGATIFLGAFGEYNPTTDDAVAQVSNVPQAGDADELTYATLEASNLNVLAVQVSGEAWVQLKFPSPRTPYSTTYVRMDEVTAEGANLDLIATVGGLLGLLENDVIIPEVYTGATATADGTMIDGDNVNATMVRDEAGHLYLAVTASEAYDAVRVKLRNQGNLLGLAWGSTFNLNVYDAFTVDDPTCGQAMFTELGEVEGINLDLSETVINPEYVLDDNTSNYSEIRLGLLAAGASASQTIHFTTLSEPNSILNVRMQVNPTALNLNLIGAYGIRAYNGTTVVDQQFVSGGLIGGVDVLGLLNAGGIVTVPFEVALPYDRVEVILYSTANLATDAGLRLYQVSRTSASCPPPPPTPNPLISPVCASAVIVDQQNADDPQNAVDDNFDSYATIRSDAGILVGIGDNEGYLEVAFASPVPVGKTAYVRIDYEDDILNALLAGSLGIAAQNLVLGDHYFDVALTNGGAPVLSASGDDGFADANGQIRIVQDGEGRYYIAIKADNPFTNIRLTDHTDALLGVLSPDQYLNVYSVCYENSEEICDPAFATYYDGSGLTLDILDIGSAGVANAHRAIDHDTQAVEDDGTYSEINIGGAGIGASLFQFANFHTLSLPTDYFKIKLGVENGSALNVELLNNIEIRAYNGEELVYAQRVQDGLVAGLDILGLLTADNVVTIPIGPGVPFDRVAIGISTLADLDLFSNPLRVYSIKRFGIDCPDPNPLPNYPDTESPFTGPDCGVTLGEFENVNFPHNAIDGDHDTPARLSAGSGVVLGAGAYNGYIEMNYDAPVPALETSYIRIDMADEGLLDALVGGSLGELLADVGDLALFGTHYFDISVRNAAGNEIYDASSLGGFDEEDNGVRIVRDEFGRYYIAFTAGEPYQSVRITLNNTAVAGLDAVTTMDVFGMCRETVFDPCEQATFTSFDGTGLSANLLEGADPAGVINPQYVIDGNNANYAEFSLGDAAIGATLYQDIYFKTKVTTTATDKLRLRLQTPGNLINADILGAYTVYLFNGDVQVGDAMTLQEGLINDADLLNLFNSGGVIGVEFEPGAGIVYDRVRFEIGSVAAAGIGSPIRLYGVYRISDACPDPEFEQPPFEVCADVFLGTNEYVDDIQNLTDGNHNSYATVRSDAGLVGGIGEYSGYVELGYGAVVPAGTSSYIRIGYDEDVLNALLAGSLGNLVDQVLDGVALSEHYFNVTVKGAGGTELFTASSADLFDDASGQVRLVQDTKGRYYLEITPTVDYQSVRLEDHTTALLGALSEGHLDVYGMCHTPTTFECTAAFSTSYEGSGLSLDLLNIGGAGVQNAFWAIDQNTTNASTLSLGSGAIGTSATVQQNIQFNQVLPADAEIIVKLKVDGGVLDASLLSGLEVIGYLDGVETTFSEDFNQAFLEADILGLLNGNDPVEVTITPGVEVDEIAIRLSGLVSVATPTVSIYHVIPLCTSFAGSYLEVTANGAIADGVAANEVTATILNQDGDALANQEVVFTIVNVDGTTTTQTVTTDADGKAAVPITSTLAGDATVTATVGGMVISTGSPAVVTFVAGPADPASSTLAVTKDNAVADGTDYNELTATVTDANGNPVAGQDVVFGITYPDGTAGTETVTTDAEGKAVLPITSTTAGEAPVTATVGGTAISGSPATVTFIAGPADPASSTLAVTKDNAVADGTDYNELTATVTDANGNPVAGQDVVFGITYPDGTAGTETVTTDAEGKAVLPITSTTAGEAPVTATVGGTAISGSPATTTFIAGPADPGSSVLEVTKDGAIANGTDYNELTATVMDANGNPVAGEEVAFAITYPDGTTGTETVTTDENGEAVLPITSTTVGEATVAATVGGTAISGSPATVTFVADVVDNEASTLEVTRDNAVADGADYNEVTATIVDATGNPLEGVGVFFEITYPDGTAGTESVLTDAAGEAVLPIRSTTAGEATVAATVGGEPITGSPVTVTFITGPVDPGASTLAVTKDNAVADGTDYNEFTATVTDATGNPVAGQDVVFEITYPDGTTGTETVTTDENGEAVLPITSTTAGEATVAATIGGEPLSGSPATATFVAGPADPASSTLAVTKDNAVADGTDYNELTATVTDANGNPVAGQDVVFGITYPDGTAGTETVTTDAEGKAVLPITSTTAGEAPVTATVGGTAISGSPATVTFIAGPADPGASTLEVTKDGAVADGVDPNEFTATVTDANGNPVAGQDVVFEITYPDGTTGTETIPTDENGQAVLPVTSTEAGEVTVAATIGGEPLSGSPATATFVAGPADPAASELTVTKDNALADGVDPDELTATVTDANGNPVAGQDVVFGITYPDGTTGTETIPTGENGQAILSITSTTAGEATVTATIGGTAISGSPATVTFIASPADPGASTLEVTKDGAVADGVDPNEFTATVTDANGNPVAGQDVVFEITYPDGTTGTETIPTDENGQAVLPVTSTEAGEVTVAATIGGEPLSGSPATATFVIPNNLTITKVADEDRVQAGTSTSFTLTITNDGPSEMASGKVISLGERPSEGVTITGYTVTSGNGTATGTGNSATVTTSAVIPVDGTITIAVTADIATDAPATITNGVDVWGPDKDPGTDTPDDGDDTPEIPVDPNHTLSITKVADQDRVQAGASTSFTVTITNSGPSSIASGAAISVAERPGEGVTVTGYEVSSGNATVNGTGNAATVTTTAPIPAQGTITLTITADIAAQAEGTITNGIAVWSPDKDPDTDEPDDETETPEIPVDPNRMLSITKVADQETVTAGMSTTFTVTVTNDGPSGIAAGEIINLEERPGAGMAVTGYEVTSGNATVTGTGNAASLTTTSAIAAGGTITIRVMADVTAAAGATISNGIAVWGPDKDPDTDEVDDETETPEIPVAAPYTLSIEKVADQSLVNAGETTTFTVTVTNNGPMEIESGKVITLEERPGVGVAITGYEIVSGAATISGNGNNATITTNGVVANGSTIVVRITAMVDPTTTGTITNGIAVWGPNTDPDTEDPEDEDEVEPIPVDETLGIPNLFTPNGDGLNDLFVIKNLLQYQGRELIVLNRWGNQVYKSTNYNNDWDGNTLAEGTYYYILRVRGSNNGEWQTHKGAIAIIRVTGR